jgi:Mg2+-importing ATPase
MLIFGLTSSLFDFVTFYMLYGYYDLTIAQFRTGWFMESLATQTLVVFIIRTNHIPFIQSRPGKYLVMSVLLCLATGWILPYTGFATVLGFEMLPAPVLISIIGLVLLYLVVAELMKRFIYYKLH